MPYLPTNSKCQTLACDNPRSKRSPYCLEHGGFDTHRRYRNEHRDKAARLYGSKAWQKIRVITLSATPLCASCIARGMVCTATDVDHVFPWRLLNEQAFYLNKFQPLCDSCHSVKTAMEKKGHFFDYSTGRAYTLNEYQTIISGRPNTA